MVRIEGAFWAYGKGLRNPRGIAHAFRFASAAGAAWSLRSVCERVARGEGAHPEAPRCKACQGMLTRLRFAAALAAGGGGGGKGRPSRRRLLGGDGPRGQVEGVLRVSAGLERYHAAGGDLRGRAALGVPARSRAFVEEGKVAEADNLDRLAAYGGLFQECEEEVDGGGGLELCERVDGGVDAMGEQVLRRGSFRFACLTSSSSTARRGRRHLLPSRQL